MISPSKRHFKDFNEEDFYNDKIAYLKVDDLLDDVETERCAWDAVLRRRVEDE